MDQNPTLPRPQLTQPKWLTPFPRVSLAGSGFAYNISEQRVGGEAGFELIKAKNTYQFLFHDTVRSYSISYC